MATDTRDRLVDVSATLFQRQGMAATGIKQILTEAGAPFSSLYHHFPGGKDELAGVAIRTAGAGYQQIVEAVWDDAPDVLASIDAVFTGAAAVLEESDFADACPIAVIALEVASTNEPLRLATAEVFDAWHESLTERLVAGGLAPSPASSLAFAVVALLEGGFLLSRAGRTTEPMLAAGAAAKAAVQASLGERDA